MEEPDSQPASDEELVDKEADAAAAEAAGIGGRGSHQEADPAEQPIAEGGGGEAEGFEQAEKDLIEHASHGDPAPDPTAPDQAMDEGPGDDAEHGAADHVRATEQKDEEQTH